MTPHREPRSIGSPAAAAVAARPPAGNRWLALGFGGLQVGFGIHIARHHGG